MLLMEKKNRSNIDYIIQVIKVFIKWEKKSRNYMFTSKSIMNPNLTASKFQAKVVWLPFGSLKAWYLQVSLYPLSGGAIARLKLT